MDERETNDDEKEASEQNGLQNKESDQNEIADVEAVPTLNQQQIAKIFKLDIDCFEESFDFLALKDIISIGTTCKRLNQVAGYIVNQVYTGGNVYYTEKSICIRGNTKIDHFIKWIPKISILRETNFQHFITRQSKFRRLREIGFFHCQITAAKMECIAGILNKVESLHLNRCDIDGNLFETIISFCPNLKRLCIASDAISFFKNGTQNDWLLRTYPKLEYFGLVVHGEINEQTKFPELIAFLEHNSNIQTLFVSPNILWVNRESIFNSSIKLDELAVFVDRTENVNFCAFLNLLKELDERGFFKQLQLTSSHQDIDQKLLNQMTSLVKLEIGSIYIKLSAFTELKELYIDASYEILDWNEMVKNLTKLERILFLYATLDNISFLVANAVRLTKILVYNLTDSPSYRARTKNLNLDLQKWNRDREKLSGARKTTIFAPEGIYLQTKWTQSQTNFNLIRLMRTDSYKRQNNFHIFGKE